MAAAVKAPVNAELLRWARHEFGLSLAEAALALDVKPERLESWEVGEVLPTINQVRNAALLYHRTPAFFLMRGGPPESAGKRPTDFRGRGDDDRLGPVLAREMARSRTRRAWFLKLLGHGAHRLPEIEHVLQEPREAARRVRAAVDVPVARQFEFKNDAVGLQEWLNVVENMGILVFQMSRVDPEVCRGFSIYEDVYPVIVLNGAESPSARTFTLFHELAHLLSRTGALCDVWKGSGVERRCNQFAGEFLMPEGVFRTELGKRDPIVVLSVLANRFSVSQSAVAVRLRDLGIIDQNQLDQQLATARDVAKARKEAEKRRERTGGPPPHLLKLRNLGPTYVGTVLDALSDETITLVDAAYYLESKVPWSIRWMRRWLDVGAAREWPLCH